MRRSPIRTAMAGSTARPPRARALDVIEKQVGGTEVAAVVIEPIQGEGGFVEPAAGFLPALAAWCRANGVGVRRR